MTEREREIIAGEADVKDNYRYKVESLVRNRVKKKLEADLDALDGNLDDVHDFIETAVCGDVPNDAGELRDYLEEARERIADLEASLEDARTTAQERKETIADLHERLEDAPHRDDLRVAIDDLEAALETGARQDVEASLGRLKAAAGVDDE